MPSHDSFGKGLRVMETLAGAQEPLTLADIAKRADLLKSHSHKFLRTLIEHGYVEQVHERGPYRLTLRLWDLGHRASAGKDLITAARHSMQELTRQTGETSTIAVYENGEAIYVYKVEGSHELRTSAEIGRHRPAYCVAAGKAMLAFKSKDVLEGVLLSAKRHTGRTIVSRPALLAELEDVRRRGYAVNWGEWIDSVRGLAAPIRNVEGTVVAALNISIPAERLDKKAVARLAPLVVAGAAQISRALGYNERPHRGDRPPLRRTGS